MDLYKDFQAASVLMQARCFILTPKGGGAGFQRPCGTLKLCFIPFKEKLTFP
jgi:hypothetical protein